MIDPNDLLTETQREWLGTGAAAAWVLKIGGKLLKWGLLHKWQQLKGWIERRWNELLGRTPGRTRPRIRL